MANEGSLYKGTFGEDTAHTYDHQPVLQNGILEDGHGGVAVGTLLIKNTSGKLEKYSGTGQLIGVCAVTVMPAQSTVTYLAHGTVKAGKAILEDGTLFTEYDKLNAIGIYAV